MNLTDIGYTAERDRESARRKFIRDDLPKHEPEVKPNFKVNLMFSKVEERILSSFLTLLIIELE